MLFWRQLLWKTYREARHRNLGLACHLAAAGSSDRGKRRLVADQRSAEAGDNRWATRQARPRLLANAGGRTPDARTVRNDAAADYDAGGSGELTSRKL